MKLGTRIVLQTVAIVITALALYGFVSVRIRRAELRADLEKQTQSVGRVLQVSLQAALDEGLFEDVRRLVARIRASQPGLAINYVEIPRVNPSEPAAPTVFVSSDGGAHPTLPDGGAPSQPEPATAEDDESSYVPPPADYMRDDRVQRIQVDGQPYGEHIERDGRPYYAFCVPLFDEQSQVVAAIDLVREESDAKDALAKAQQNVAITVVLLGLGLALLVWLTTERSISHPLQRLVEGIDEVAHGDLTRVILREREDEIGDLADRFNQMTGSLREARDETERSVEARLTLEARLRQSEKLATLGQVAASIAHEVGTPLGVIGGRARTMEKKAADPQEVQKNASIIAAQAARITRIIQRLLDYARKKVTTREKVDFAAVAKDSIDFLEHQFAASNVTVRLHGFQPEGEGAPNTPHVAGDADELQQVCLNLLLNAIQAMPKGGAIDVTLRGALRRKPGLEVAPPARYVALEVEDEGGGIPPEDRDRIFEPFYSTKQEAGGTGLGLAVSLGLVKDHDGWIDIDPGSRGGTLFRVFLPAPDEEEQSEAPVA